VAVHTVCLCNWIIKSTLDLQKHFTYFC